MGQNYFASFFQHTMSVETIRRWHTCVYLHTWMEDDVVNETEHVYWSARYLMANLQGRAHLEILMEPWWHSSGRKWSG
ncbi:hypothetical protein J6590_015533 [Homalodisca vitripennis]|nr:hypothetical protein J6590_015533 [Homalodisca vitripennis]